ncbi:MAG: hypothetical protein JW908_14240 [Anaerolineales bacterium]|nr:hypothetical protein [Anaerolineales bacterium]
MKKKLTFHDWEALSAFLDGRLSLADKSRLESRLTKEPELREGLEGLQHTRTLLRNSPKIRAPHNFTLTRQMAGMKEKQTPGYIYPWLKFSTVIASILFVFALLGDFFVNQTTPITPLQVHEMAPVALPNEEAVAEQEMSAAYPTMPLAGTTPIPTEAAAEKSFELSNAPMEPLPSTMPSVMEMEASDETEEMPVLSAPFTEEEDMQPREAVTASDIEGEMETGAKIPTSEMETMADQATQTEEIKPESSEETMAMGYGEAPESYPPSREINVWRVLQIVFGLLIIIFGVTAFFLRTKKII